MLSEKDKKKSLIYLVFRSVCTTFAADNQLITTKMDDYPADNYNS